VNPPVYLPADTPPEEIPEPSADQVVHVLASTRQRVAARIIDWAAFILTAIAVLAGPIALAVAVGPDSFGTFVLPVIIAGLVLDFLAIGALRVGRLAWFGCTVGQRVVGLRVVLMEDGTTKPGWRQAYRRWAIPQNNQFIPALSDFLAHRRDKKYGQCLHDRHAGTVVVRVQPPLVPVKTSGLKKLTKSDEAPALVPDAAWARRERWHRIILGSVIVIPLAAAVVTPPLLSYLASRPPAFEFETFYDDRVRFTNRYNGIGVTYERTSASVKDDAKGCLAGATTEQARAVLRRLKCEGRIEAAFRTTDGVLVSSHVLKFPSPSAAARAKDGLAHTDLRFVPGGPTSPPGGAQVGKVGDEDRYVVVTMAVSPKQPDAELKTKNAFSRMHAPVLNVIVWMDV